MDLVDRGGLVVAQSRTSGVSLSQAPTSTTSAWSSPGISVSLYRDEACCFLPTARAECSFGIAVRR